MTVAPRRRWSFSLRAMLVGIFLLTIPAAWIGRELHIASEREAMRIRIERCGTASHSAQRFLDWAPTTETWEIVQQWDRERFSYCRKVIGERPTRQIEFNKHALDASERMRIRELFPEATIFEVSPKNAKF